MIVFKDAEKHEPKEEGEYLCILKDREGYFYSRVLWEKESGWEIIAEEILSFSETPPETALKGISEDPKETVYK